MNQKSANTNHSEAEPTFVPSSPQVEGDAFATCNTPASDSRPELGADSVSTHIGRYVIKQVLGKGAFGLVLLAYDSDLQRQVAIKLPRGDRFVSDDEAAAFLEEARTVARLKHPGIVAVHDVGRTENNSPFVVLEFVNGRSLHSELKLRKLTPPEIAQLMADVADAVAYAHKQGFVHRDLKPANVLLDERGRPQVADFGLALHESQQSRRIGEYAGTVAYMSPEQVRGEAHRLDGRTDIWSMGIMLYYMLVGRLPFGGTSIQAISDEILHREPKPPRQIDDTIHPELERIINRCCQKRISDRYSTATDLSLELRTWLAAEFPSRGSSPSIDRLKEGSSPSMGIVSSHSASVAPSTAGTDASQNQTSHQGASDRSHANLNRGPWSRILPYKKVLVGVICASGLAIGIGLSRSFFPSAPPTPAPIAAGSSRLVTSYPQAQQSDPNDPITGTLDVLIWNTAHGKHPVKLRDPAFKSLKHDDQVRVEAHLSRPGYVYLLWIDAAGEVQPLYPWVPGRWDRRPDHETPIEHLALPEKADLGWPIEGPAGMETLVLMSRDTPFSDDDVQELRLALKGLPEQSQQQSGSIVDFLNGKVVTLEQDQNRGPKFFDAQRIDDPILQTQARLQAALKDRVRYMRAVSFANRGSR